MKRYSLILTALVCLLAMPAAAETSDGFFRDSDSFTVAKAVKLGREMDSTFNSRSILDTNGGTSGVEEGKDCDANCTSCNKSTGTCSRCSGGRYLKNNLCLVCPSYASCNGTTSYTCNSMYRKSNDSCVSNCSGVSCKSGATAKATSSGCCCELTSCPSGQRLSGSSCVSNCTGVSCKSGYIAKASSTGCCCEADKPVCGAGKVYNTTIKKCVDAVCPMGCLDSCVNGCGSCASGRYLNYNNGSCPLCSETMTGCSTCSGASTCTSCQSGYTLSGGKCTKIAITCPANCASCSSSSTCTRCNSGYTLSGGRCTKALTPSCSTCEAGYTKNLKSCPSNMTMQYGRICVDSGFSCGKCVPRTSSGGGGGGGGGGNLRFQQETLMRQDANLF